MSNYKRTFKAPTPLDLREIKSLQQHRLIKNELIGLNPANVAILQENYLIRVISTAAKKILKGLRLRPKLFYLLRKHVSKLPLRIQNFIRSLILNHSSGSLIREFVYSLDLGFALPTSNTPLVTIVIPVHNNWWVTYECLRYIQSGINETPFEVVVVDDCSSDLTREALGNIRGVHIITNTINLGYLHSTNLGASIASSTSTHILLLNNDTKPGINWLDELYRECELDSKIAIAGSALVYPNGILQEAGSQIFRDGSGWNLGRGDSFPNPMHSTVREVDYCSAASVLVRKDFWESRGGYDVRFAPAYYEDTDLAFSARSLGFKVVCVPTSVVIHHEGLSHGVSVDSGLKRFQEINRHKFVDKWKLELNFHWENEGFPRIESTRESKGIVVICDQQLPALQRDSGSQRTMRLINHVSKLGYHVVLGAIDPTTSEIDLVLLRHLGVEVHYDLKNLVDSLQTRISRVRAIWLIRPNVIEQVRSMLPELGPKILLIGDFLDLPNHKGGQMRVDPRTLRIAKSLDKCVLVSRDEANYLKTQGVHNVTSVWHDFQVHNIDRCWKNTSGAIFVGGFRHQPNVEGLTWFINAVLPIITREEPNFKLRIIGSGYPAEFVESFHSVNLEFIGHVPDLFPYYATSRMSLVPLLSGAGMKGKLAEALSFGLPVVSTSIGVEGFGFTAEETPVLQSDSPEGFAQACLTLNKNESLNSDLGLKGLRYIELNLSEEAVRNEIKSILTRSENT